MPVTRMRARVSTGMGTRDMHSEVVEVGVTLHPDGWDVSTTPVICSALTIGRSPQDEISRTLCRQSRTPTNREWGEILWDNNACVRPTPSSPRRRRDRRIEKKATEEGRGPSRRAPPPARLRPILFDCRGGGRFQGGISFAAGHFQPRGVVINARLAVTLGHLPLLGLSLYDRAVRTI